MKNNSEELTAAILDAIKNGYKTKSGLARQLSEQFQLPFDNVRSRILYYTGSSGALKRKKRKIAERPCDSWSGLPESFATKWNPFVIPHKTKKCLVLSDIHIPYYDKTALIAALNAGLDYGCDSVYLNGDILDCYQLSSFCKDPRARDFPSELDDANKFLDAICGRFQYVYFKEGNHEERHTKNIFQKCPAYAGVESFELHCLLHLHQRGISFIRSKQVSKFGHLWIYHGHETRLKSANVNPARTAYLKTKVCCLLGHLHRESAHIESCADGKIISCYSSGHLGEDHPEYAPVNNWTKGFAIVERSDKTDGFHVSLKKIINGKVY